MNRVIFVGFLVCIWGLFGCAMTPEQQRALNEAEQGFNQNQRNMQQVQGNPGQGAACGPNQIAPLARPGCQFVCINGAWAETCN